MRFYRWYVRHPMMQDWFQESLRLLFVQSVFPWILLPIVISISTSWVVNNDRVSSEGHFLRWIYTASFRHRYAGFDRWVSSPCLRTLSRPNLYNSFWQGMYFSRYTTEKYWHKINRDVQKKVLHIPIYFNGLFVVMVRRYLLETYASDLINYSRNWFLCLYAVLWIALHTLFTLYVCRQSHYAIAGVKHWQFFYMGSCIPNTAGMTWVYGIKPWTEALCLKGYSRFFVAQMPTGFEDKYQSTERQAQTWK